jgi:uncharacterized iron-regulated membrane protein
MRLPSLPGQRRIHRRLAYVIFLPAMVFGLTGLVLAVREPLDRWWAPDLYAITPGALRVAALPAAVAHHAPGRTPQIIRLPQAGDPVIVRLRGEPSRELFLDPGTLALLGERDPRQAPGAVLLDLHRRLALGGPGEWAMGLAGLVLTAVLASGALLWWRSPRRWALGVRAHHAGRDGHRLLGVICLPLLLLIVGTGVAISFPDTTRLVLGQPPRARAAAPTAGSATVESAAVRPPPAWDTLLTTAGVPAPTVLAFPRRPGDPITVRNADGIAAQLDPRTGKLLGRTTGREPYAWIVALHTGTALGGWGTICGLVGGGGLLGLLVTGWRLRPQSQTSPSSDRLAE